MERRGRLVKLVRDRVALFAPDGRVEYRPLDSPTDHRIELRKKLLEEAAEYLLSPSLGELADLQAVIDALCTYDLGRSLADLKAERLSKAVERGEFAEGIGMYCSTTAPPDHEGDKA